LGGESLEVHGFSLVFWPLARGFEPRTHSSWRPGRRPERLLDQSQHQPERNEGGPEARPGVSGGGSLGEPRPRSVSNVSRRVGAARGAPRLAISAARACRIAECAPWRQPGPPSPWRQPGSARRGATLTTESEQPRTEPQISRFWTFRALSPM